MPRNRLDKDTAKVLEMQKLSHDWVNSDGYKEFKKRLMTKVVEATSLLRLTALPGYSNEQILSDYGARKMLGQLLVQTLQEIEADANSYQSNWELLNKTEEDSMMIFFPEERSETKNSA
jgi:hypothetical protein